MCPSSLTSTRAGRQSRWHRWVLQLGVAQRSTACETGCAYVQVGAAVVDWTSLLTALATATVLRGSMLHCGRRVCVRVRMLHPVLAALLCPNLLSRPPPIFLPPQSHHPTANTRSRAHTTTHILAHSRSPTHALDPHLTVPTHTRTAGGRHPADPCLPVPPDRPAGSCSQDGESHSNQEGPVLRGVSHAQLCGKVSPRGWVSGCAVRCGAALCCLR